MNRRVLVLLVSKNWVKWGNTKPGKQKVLTRSLFLSVGLEILSLTPVCLAPLHHPGLQCLHRMGAVLGFQFMTPSNSSARKTIGKLQKRGVRREGVGWGGITTASDANAAWKGTQPGEVFLRGHLGGIIVPAPNIFIKRSQWAREAANPSAPWGGNKLARKKRGLGLKQT